MDEKIEKIKKLIINMLQELNDNNRKRKKQLKSFIICLFLTFLPILIFLITPVIGDKYFDTFAGSFMYISSDHYFSFSPSFVLNLPYFLIPIIWGITLWLCIKLRKAIQNRKSFFNYLNLVLVVLNSIFLLYSLWFIYFYFLN